MRAAFITADVLAAEPEVATALRRLAEASVTPVLLLDQPLAEGERPESIGFPTVTAPPGPVGGRGEQQDLLLDAAAQAGVAVSEAFLVCGVAPDVARAVAAGCRPVLVLSGRTLDDVYGPEDPPHKEMATAVDLAAAVGYMVEEARQEQALGPFAYAPHHVLDDMSRAAMPSSGDLAKVFGVIVIAGISLALGIAYLLQEIYQTVRLPAVSYYLTLQFIPQTLRGTLFILIGVGIGFTVPRLLRGMRIRRRYR